MSFLEDLEYVRVIGGGYFADVKLYRDPETGGRVAVKELKRQFLSNADYCERFRREIELLGELQGIPYVVGLIDSEITEDRLAYAMPVADSNLHSFIRKNSNKLTLDDRLAIFTQILQGVRAAHVKQILHRDLSPTNVLIFGDGSPPRVALCDFGLGKNQADLDAMTKSSAHSYGHAFYVAPEQRESLKAATVRSDVYSLGKLLNFVLTGRDPDKVHQCDMSVVCSRACADDPSTRYTDVEQMAGDYAKAKNLLTAPIVPQEDWTLAERLQHEADIDWLEFHNYAVGGNYNDHIYYDHIVPMLTHLKGEGQLRAYLGAIGPAADEFADALSNQLAECYGTVGWPFAAMDSFGRFLDALFHASDRPHLRLVCLRELWDLAYVIDQWAVQRIVARVIGDAEVPDEIAGDFAMHISESCVSAEKPRFASRSVHAAIRNAIEGLSWSGDSN